MRERERGRERQRQRETERERESFVQRAIKGAETYTVLRSATVLLLCICSLMTD